MYIQTKRMIQRNKCLTAAVRFAGQLKPTWRKVMDDLVLEREEKDKLTLRDRKIEQYLSLHPVKKLQIGSGTNPLPGWLNTDFEPTDEKIIFLDATRPFPFDDGAFDYVFSEHMIEHIPYKAGMFMMQEIYRVLRPSGKVRIATPDIEKIVGLFSAQKTMEQRQYIRWKVSDNMGLYSAQRSRLQQRRKEWDIDYRHITRFYPDIEEDGVCFIVNNLFRGYGHQYLYDVQSLQAITGEAGFVGISMFEPGESDDENLRDVESHASLIGDEMNAFETMVLQAVRP